jgi:hypothetical protein
MGACSQGKPPYKGCGDLAGCVPDHVNADGGKKILIDTRAIKSNTADIGFDSKNSVLFVPTFFKNKVVAYKYSVTN